MKKLILHTFCAVVFLSLAAVPAFPQADVTTARLRGTVTDESNAVIPGATVTVRDLDRGIAREATSDALGVYQVPLLPPGAYEVRVSAAGFITRVLTRVELTVGQVAIFDAHLRVGAVTQEVMVSAEAPLVETERTQQANTILQTQIANLPNLGRDFTSYVFTLPGVSSSTLPRVQNPGFTFGSSGFSMGGSNGRNNLITMDGGENEYGSGQLRTNISVEAVQEFQVNRNAFNAEFGFTAGTAINVITKSGSNNWHGSVYTYYRSQRTSARNFFDTSRRKAFDQQIYPGFTLGGPIVKDKAFFFTSYEALKSDAARFRDYISNTAVLGPTAAQAAYLGQLAASTDVNVRRIGQNLRGAFTTGSYPNTMKLLTENSGAFVSPDRLHNWTTRMDYQVNARNSLGGRFSWTHNDTDGIGVGRTNAPNSANDLFYRDYTAVATWNRVIRPTLFNLVRMQFAPRNSARTLPKAPQSTSLLISGIGNFGRNFTAPFNTFQDRYQFEDALAWNRGRHNFKFGASYRPVNYRVINELWFSGEWTFSAAVFPAILAVPAADQVALATFNATNGIPTNGPTAASLSAIQSFNLGLPFLFRQGFNNPEWQDWAHYWGFFAQDSWKAHPRLTLDLGLRFDYDREPKPLNANGYFSPRFGFAWDALGNKKTVVRGGIGLFYSPVYYQVDYVTNILNDSGKFINQIFKTPADGAQAPAVIWAAGAAKGKLPFTALNQADFDALRINTGRGAPGRVIFDADRNYKNNYSVQASFSVAHQIANDLSLEVGWLATRGVHIQLPHEVNYREKRAGDPAPLFVDGIGPQLVRIDPTITQNNIYKSVGNSIYHGLTASLTKRYSRNTQFQLNYTFSKAIDDQTDFNSSFAAFLPTNLRLERALSVFDIRHNFVVNGVFQSPFQAGPGHHPLARAFADITLSPIIQLRSGIPFTLRAGRDTNGDTHSLYDRPFYASRNTGRGENFYNVNLRLTKQFYAHREKGLRVDFIAEVTNLFNHTNFLAVNDVVGTPAAILAGPFNLRGDRTKSALDPLGFTATTDPRRFQFGLKIAF